MKRLFAALATSVALAAAPLSAQTISTAGDWTGSINQNWDQSAQTLNFTGNVTLNTFSFWLGVANTHQVLVREWASGPGPVLFSTTTAFNAGYNQLLLNLALSGGTQYAVQFNYLGLIPSTVHFNQVNGYADGEWWLNGFNTWSPYDALDMRFEATYSPASVVPEPSSFALFGLGAASLLMVRRRIRRA